MKLSFPLLAALGLLVVPIAGRAQTVIASSYNGTTPGGVPALGNVARTGGPITFSGLGAGVSFTTGAQNYTFTSVVANLQLLTGSSADLTAGIYSNSSGAPGTLLASLTVPSMTALTQANYTFTTGGTLTFGANTTYWFVVAPTTSNTNLVSATWYNGTSGTGLVTAALNTTGTSFGSWVPDLVSTSLSYQVSGSAIPEPSTYALAIGGLALGFVVWRRRSAIGAA